MEIDINYVVPGNSSWEYINRHIRAESVNLALFRAGSDIFTNKKTIWNAASRLVPSGIFCIQAEVDNISYLIKVINDQGLKYKVVYFDFSWAKSGAISIFLLVYKNDLFVPSFDEMNRIESYAEMGSRLMSLCDFGDIVLCIDNAMLQLAPQIKRLGRHVIGFGNNIDFINSSKKQGIKGVQL